MSAEEVAVRAAEAGDFESVLSVINDGATAYRGQIPDDAWKEPYMSREELRGEIDDAGIDFLLATSATSGEVVAVMGTQRRDVSPPYPNVTLIRHAYTRTAWQRLGVGRLLLERLLDATSRPVLIGTWAANTIAIGFYERSGFELVADEKFKEELLRTYWFNATLGAANDDKNEYRAKQIAASVVLADEKWRQNGDAIKLHAKP